MTITRRREKQEPILRSVNSIGFGSIVIWGGVMAIATIVSISSAIKLRRRKTHPPPPPPLPPVFNYKTDIKQEESECLGKGLHDFIPSDLKGKTEPTEVAGIKETDSIDVQIKKNPILEDHEEYHETNTQTEVQSDDQENGEDGKEIADNVEEETKRGACDEEDVDEITMEEYGAAEDDSTEEDEENSDNSESKKVTKFTSRIEGQMMDEVKTESEKENQEKNVDETEESGETGDSSSGSNSNVEEMCLHLKNTHMGLTDDHKLLKRKGRGNQIDDNLNEVMMRGDAGSSESEILMRKNWSKVRIMIAMTIAMVLLVSLVNTVKKPTLVVSSFP